MVHDPPAHAGLLGGGTQMKHGGNVWDDNRPAQWLDFSANLRPEGTPAWVMHVMEEALKDTRYYPDRAMKAARKGLAEWLGVPENQVLPTAGGAAAIDLILSIHTGTVYTYPITFGEYAERAMVHKRPCAAWQGQCGQKDTVMLCNPNNPTGTCASRSEMMTIWEKTKACGGELVVDEAFIDFCPEHTVRHEVQNGLSVVGSLTKTLCIPGVRLGYVCAAPDVIQQLEQRALPWSLSTLASAVASELPKHRDEIHDDFCKNTLRRKQLSALLQALQAEVWPSQSNFLLVDFKRDMTAVADWLKTQGILVRTCSSFGLPASFLRLAVKTETENDVLIHALKEGMEKNNAR